MSSSLRRLRYFLRVCETLHIGHAAEALGIAQPALSLQIKALEQDIGLRLFHRRKRGIELTAAGAAYRHEVERLLQAHLEAVETAHRAARGESGSIQIGYVGSAAFEPAFPALLAQARKSLPNVRLSMHELRVEQQLMALERGEIDVAVMRPPIPPMLLAPQSLGVSRRRLLLALPLGHPLLDKRRVSIKDLAGESLIDLLDPPLMGVTRIVNDMAERAGVYLHVEWRVSEVASILGLVAAGMGVGVVPESVAQLRVPSVAFREISDPAAMSELRYYWLEPRMTPVMQRFIQLARQLSQGDVA